MKLKNILILLIPIYSFAQWQPDVRLTNDPAFSGTSGNNARSIASSGNIVHVLWHDNRDGNYEIYYKRSTNGGISWATDTRFTNDTAVSENPSVTLSGSVVHAVWQDNRDGNTEIYYKHSTDDGASWESEERLTNDFSFSLAPSVSVFGSVVHVVWQEGRDGNGEIYYKRSINGGISWAADTRLTNLHTNSFSGFSSVSASASVVHVVWQDNRDGPYAIYSKSSTDGGNSWGADTRLTNSSFSGPPSASVSDSIVHVVWRDGRDGNGEIYYKRSSDGGLTWGTDTRLTNNSYESWFPSITVSGQIVHVVWYDERDGNSEIYHKRATDGGVSWGVDTRLTINSSGSYDPFVSVSGSVVHVVWQDHRDGNYEIYYKRNPTGNPIAIIYISTQIPRDFSLSHNYPNPFNPSTQIEFSIPKNNEFVILTVFDVTGREITTLVNQQINAGTYKVEFNGEYLASGLYFYKLVVGDFTQTKKMILIK
jgi:hypothetical protein